MDVGRLDRWMKRQVFINVKTTFPIFGKAQPSPLGRSIATPTCPPTLSHFFALDQLLHHEGHEGAQIMQKLLMQGQGWVGGHKMNQASPQFGQGNNERHRGR